MLKKEDGLLDFTRSAEELARCVRAFNPWPGTFIIWQDQVLKIHRASAVATSSSDGQPGQHTLHNGMPAIGTAQGLLVLEDLQPAGKRPMPGKVFVQGARNWST